MGGFFYLGEKKVRPDNYHRIVNNTVGNETPGAEAGVGFAVVSGTWGELNKAVTIESSDDYRQYIGDGSGYEVVKQLFKGGVSSVVLCRVGSGGSSGSLTLQDSASKDVLTLTAKYPGTKSLSISIKESLADSAVKEAVLYEGTAKLESYSIVAGADEVTQLAEALASSSYVTAKKQDEGSGILAEVAQSEFSGGADPAVTTESYSNGLSAIEASLTHNMCVAVDTDDTAVHTLLAAWLERVYQAGDYPLAVVSGTKATAVDTRIKTGASYNDEKMHYVLGGWTDSDGVEYNGYPAAARIAGMVAAVPSSESITHSAISGAVDLTEQLTNTQIENALKNGCLVISKSKATKKVRVEKGINTLVDEPSNMDKGWEKIRRTKTRFELMYRIDEATDAMNGKVNNDSDGLAAIIAAGQAVIDAMIGEKKLSAGEFALDTSKPAEGDSAWFTISADDIDSYEIGYLTYGFRFSAANTEE